jgi:hypothetical protein
MGSRSNFGAKVSDCLGNPAAAFDIEEGSCVKGKSASCYPYTNTDKSVTFPACCLEGKDPKCYGSGSAGGPSPQGGGENWCYPEGHGQLYQGDNQVSGMGKSGEAVICGTCGKYQFKDQSDRKCYGLSDDPKNPGMCSYTGPMGLGCGSKSVSTTKSVLKQGSRNKMPQGSGNNTVKMSQGSGNNTVKMPQGSGNNTVKMSQGSGNNTVKMPQGSGNQPNKIDPLMVLLIIAILGAGLYFFVLKKKGKSFFGKRK